MQKHICVKNGVAKYVCKVYYLQYDFQYFKHMPVKLDSATDEQDEQLHTRTKRLLLK